ncbi:MAG TPA: 4-(cytidine 5'-diphospho)-2-C-methyl-D-erythritol kinase [Alphaproteobacteria bacterium]|nr:4-(cytidine 5'-diphospho)-2-C-methyl-D-erythritol kinase [Alphaproteobacteria bacterium]HNS43704.1 4-(cytidine 5'-diphospho)-2-C-methyl-D-erythritol kinase [Alphaproteobacteria bacterium]
MTRVFTAPAKINLHLHVLGKTENNYHLLDSLVAFTAFGDNITIEPSEKFSLHITGPFARELAGELPEDNLITKSIAALSEKTGKNFPFRITLEKNIPVGGGLGGGSSDCATLLKEMAEIYGIQADLSGITSALGSDITACLHAPHPVIMRGTGNDITKDTPYLPPCPLLLVNPRKHCATPTVYKNLSMENFSAPVSWLDKFDTPKDLADFLNARTTNDLTAPAIKTEPVIAEVLEEIGKQPDCLLSRLSGSGATCFGIFPTTQAASTAAAQIKTTHPHWWVVETNTL